MLIMREPGRLPGTGSRYVDNTLAPVGFFAAQTRYERKVRGQGAGDWLSGS